MSDADGVKIWPRVRAECPRCGEIVDVNSHDCDGDLEFDGVCPMCGQPYDTYLEHLKACDGGR